MDWTAEQLKRLSPDALKTLQADLMLASGDEATIRKKLKLIQGEIRRRESSAVVVVPEERELTRSEIRRCASFARNVHDSFKKPTDSVKQLTAYTRAIQDRYRRALREMRLGRHPEDTIIAWYQDPIQDLRRFLGTIENPYRLAFQQSPAEFREILDFVMHAVLKLDATLRDSILRIPVPPITLRDRNGEDHEFNDLEIAIRASRPRDETAGCNCSVCRRRRASEAARIVFSVRINGPDYRGNNCHPNVSGTGDLCPGEAKGTWHLSYDRRDLLSLYDLTVSVLSNYGSDNPYFHLEATGERYCADCGESVDDGYYCERCEREPLCNDCSYTCGPCGSIVCGECFASCACCGEVACDRCITVCDVCGEPCCPSCWDECIECERNVCSRCAADTGGRCDQCQEAYVESLADEDEEDEDEEIEDEAIDF